MINHLTIFFSIFICSASSLAYEIALTRVFSISLWYHFAFMVISIAMLGIGASGTVLSLYPRLKNINHISTYNILLGIGITMSYIILNQILFDPVELSWSPELIFLIGIYAITISVPFFFAGLIVITALSSRIDKSSIFYGADLLGAGCGSFGVILLLRFTEPETVIVIISLFAFSAAFLAGGRKLKVTAMLMILLTVSLLTINPSFIHLKISPYKDLRTALQYPNAEHMKTYVSPYSRIDIFKSPAVRFAPGMSLRYLEALPEQIGLTIDGSESNAITRYDDTASLAFLSHLPSALSYELIKSSLIKNGAEGLPHKAAKTDILLLDPKGGLQALIANYYGFSHVQKIESNPRIVEIINKDFRAFSGGIYSSNTWTGLGRSWLTYQEKKFDLIDIQYLSAAPSGSFGISEDYRFTVEAFREYLRHLKPEGFLSIHMYILPPPRIELRIMNTAVEAMEEFGIQDTEQHIAAIRSWGTIFILIKKSPIKTNEIETIKQFSLDRRFDLVHLPGIQEKETNLYIRMPANDYFHAFQNILHPGKRTAFTDTYVFDTKPVYDDKPFFNYYLKMKNTIEIFNLMGRKWQYFLQEGYIIFAVFLQVLIAGIILIILPVFAYHRHRNNVEGATSFCGNRSCILLPYFALIAVGFMFIEVYLIQKMILSLEHPSYAVAIILTSLLVSSGIGSLCSQAFPVLKQPTTLLLISALAFACGMLLPAFAHLIAPLAFLYKFLLVFLMVSPLGFFMGIPFPAGLRLLSERDTSLIPWAWAINGCISVLAPVLAVLIAMSSGFTTVLWCGASAYLLAFIFLIF